MKKQTVVTQYFSIKPKQPPLSPERPIKNFNVYHLYIQQQQFSPCSTIQRSEAKTKIKKNNLDDWFMRKNPQKKWPYLPKFIIYHIYKFLSLRECVTCALVCQFWKICYHNIYFQYCFFKEFDTQQYSEKELATIFKRTSKSLKHIKKVKEMIKGQKLSAFLQKTDLGAILSENSQQKGSLLEKFRLQPKKMTSSVFLTDRNLQDLCVDSYNSLQYISLVSCQFMTGKGFEVIGQCKNLTFINIQQNSHIKDENVEAFLSQINDLKIFYLMNCQNISVKILRIVGDNCKKLERLDIGGNGQMNFDDNNEVKPLGNCLLLQQLSMKENSIYNHTLDILSQYCGQLHSLNLEGCQNHLSLEKLQQFRKLQRLNIRKLRYQEDDLYQFIKKMPTLKILLANNNIMSTRIEKILLHQL